VRPVRLHLEGFGVFRAATDIDFEDADYFALVGPTGAGKSTIIDAICFALYGSIPRYGDERLVARVVSLGSQQATVSLTFDIGTDRYLATRRVRTGKGKADALLEREIEGGTEVLASGVRDTKAAIEQLLGLPFAHFTKCVVLPQGEFAKFLHDEPSKRRDLLTRLLDLGVYDRIGQRARERAKEAAKAVELLQHQLDELAFATSEARVRAETEVARLRDVYQAIDDARPVDRTDTERQAELQAGLAEADAVIARLTQVQPPHDVRDVTRERERAVAALEKTSTASTAAAAALVEAEAAVAALDERAPVARAAEAHIALADLSTRLSAAVDERDSYLPEIERAAAELEKERAHVADAQAALDTARDAHAAHALAAHLHAGDECPVCSQPIATVPKRRRPPALTKAERELERAHGSVEKATKTHAMLMQHHAAISARVEELHHQHVARIDEVADYPDPAVVVELLTTIDAAAKTLTDARTADKEARAREKKSVEVLRSVESRAGSFRAAFGELRDELLRVGCDVPPVSDDLAADWRALAEWAGAETERLRASGDSARAEIEQIDLRRRARVEELRVRAALETRAKDLETLRDDVKEHGLNARHELQRIDDAIEKAGKLADERNRARVDYDVAHTLGELLKSDRFEKWMLAEALATLVDAASNTLFELTQGHFSLRYSTDEEFVVVDHRNADETRSVRTLSGGETFQASLALALALSDQLASLSAHGAAKLDAIFCDEGFGSLDTDTLDAVASTIESLGTTGRMVGLVTHVPALAERVPVRFRVHDGTVTREET
jgi:exonuclease SbcC